MRDLAEQNKQLVEHAIAVQGRVIGMLVRAAPKALARSPRYTAGGAIAAAPRMQPVSDLGFRRSRNGRGHDHGRGHESISPSAQERLLAQAAERVNAVCRTTIIGRQMNTTVHVAYRDTHDDRNSGC